MKAQPGWTQQLGMWLGLTPAVFPVCIKSLFHFLLEATSRATITIVTRGRGRGRDVLRCGVQGHQVLLPASWQTHIGLSSHSWLTAVGELAGWLHPRHAKECGEVMKMSTGISEHGKWL